MKEKFVLNDKEQIIMNVLWASKSPISTYEMLDIPELELHYPAQLYRVLDGLQEKGLIHISGVVSSGRKYMRQFSASVTEEQFLADIVKINAKEKSILAKTAVALVGDVASGLGSEKAELDQFIEELQSIIDGIKKGK